MIRLIDAYMTVLFTIQQNKVLIDIFKRCHLKKINSDNNKYE